MPSGWHRRLAIVAALFAAAYGAILHHGLAEWQEQWLSLGERLDPGTPCNVAIVLGYTLHRDGTPTARLERRVDAAIALYEQGRTRHLLFSGGHPGGGLRVHSEAEAMRQYAERATDGGIPRKAILLEEASTSTRTNAVNSLAMVAAHRWGTAAVATSPFHQFRALRTFRCAAKGLPPERRPALWLAHVAPDMAHGYGAVLDGLLRQYDVLREVAAIAYYWLRGWLC